MLNTDYRKYEFPSKEIFESFESNYQNLVEIGELDGKYYVDVLWVEQIPNNWNQYQIYPGIDSSHTFLGYNDYQYNTAINMQLALMIPYPNYVNRDVTLIPMDNLSKLVRRTPVSNKGIKALKEYFYEDKLIWSIESIYWFNTENEKHNEDGIVKIHTWYDKLGNPLIFNERFIPLSEEDKEREMKIFRENAISYLKSRQPELFNLMYNFFSSDIKDYIDTGNKLKFEEVLTDASINHPVEIIQQTLSSVFITINGIDITVLQGILNELI